MRSKVPITNPATFIDRTQLEKMLADAPPRNHTRRTGRALVDVLDPQSHTEEHIPGSINIPQGREDLFEVRFDRAKEIVLYGRSAMSHVAEQVGEELVQRGFRRVVVYPGGVQGWKEGGHETEGRAPQASRGPGSPPSSVDHVTGLFGDAETAEEAVRSLIESHFGPEEIGVIVADREGVHEEPIRHRTGVGRNAVVGVVAGASLGAVVGALASTGVIPAHDIAFFQTGPLVAALKSAAAGTFVGFVLGALSGLEDWKEEVEIDVDAFTERSGVLVSVPAKDERARRAREVMTEAGARSVEG